MECSEAVVPENTAVRQTDSAAPAIRLLMVNSTLHIGGAERVAASLATHIDRTRLDVSACYLKQAGLMAQEMLRDGVDLQPVPGLAPGRRDYFTFLKLRALIRARGIEVIHTHDVRGLVDGALCRLISPRLRHVHTFHYGNYPERTATSRRIERALWRVPDALIAVGHEQARAIRGLYGIPASRLRVIWNGVEDPFTRAVAGAPPGFTAGEVPIIASVSTLTPQKGLHHLLDAAALLAGSGRRFRLVMAGSGGLMESLQEQSRRLGLTGHVEFLGWVPGAPARVLPACDIFVQSSLWEAMSVVVLEAMAAGKPMVVTAVGENSHVVAAGQSGLIVPPADPAALAASLGLLLDDAQLRARIGRQARARYQEFFTLRHMIGAHESLYAELAESARRRAQTR
jgi:glycosyltransferase involved in cell wall biosynthesis